MKKRKRYIRRHRKRSRPARLLHRVLSRFGWYDRSLSRLPRGGASVFRFVQIIDRRMRVHRRSVLLQVMSTETAVLGIFRDGEPRRQERHLDQAVSHSS